MVEIYHRCLGNVANKSELETGEVRPAKGKWDLLGQPSCVTGWKVAYQAGGKHVLGRVQEAPGVVKRTPSL